MQRYSNLYKQDAWNIVQNCLPITCEAMFDDECMSQDAYRKIIDEVKPDLIINDRYICSPAIVGSNIPWIWLMSAAPHYLFMDDQQNRRCPPYFSGLPCNDQNDE